MPRSSASATGLAWPGCRGSSAGAGSRTRSPAAPARRGPAARSWLASSCTSRPHRTTIDLDVVVEVDVDPVVAPAGDVPVGPVLAQRHRHPTPASLGEELQLTNYFATEVLSGGEPLEPLQHRDFRSWSPGPRPARSATRSPRSPSPSPSSTSAARPPSSGLVVAAYAARRGRHGSVRRRPGRPGAAPADDGGLLGRVRGDPGAGGRAADRRLGQHPGARRASASSTAAWARWPSPRRRR